MASIVGRFKDAAKASWSVFSKTDNQEIARPWDYGPSYGYSQSRSHRTVTNDKSIITAICTRLAIDVAAVDMLHVRVDEDDRFIEKIKSGLNDCLTVEANIDQGARAFRQDVAMTLFDQGVIAIVPVETSSNPLTNGGYDIRNLRVGKVLQWFPQHVRIELYNERNGLREEVTLPKQLVAIVENPMYSVMNEPNSTLQRLMRKLNILDAIDEQMGSGKLDLIIQLPYVIKSDARREQAEARRKDIEVQMSGSKYGIAYTDGTEKITQLNRPAENNMLGTVEMLTAQLYGQLGLTKEIFDGTASEAVMLNYYNRTIEPILTAITEAMSRTFLTKTARTQGHSIEFYRDPFKLVAIGDIAEIADKFNRNEIMTGNEIRSIIGKRPSKDPKADELKNSNMPQVEAAPTPQLAIE